MIHLTFKTVISYGCMSKLGTFKIFPRKIMFGIQDERCYISNSHGIYEQNCELFDFMKEITHYYTKLKRDGYKL